MLPLDYILLIGILIVTAIGAYALILRRLKLKPLQPSSEIPKPATENQKPQTERRTKKRRKKTSKTKTAKQQSECTSRIQYLMTLPETATVPDECLECSDALECLNRARTEGQLKKKRSSTSRNRTSRTRRRRQKPKKPEQVVAGPAH